MFKPVSFFRVLPLCIGVIAGMAGVCIIAGKEGKCPLVNRVTEFFEDRCVSFANEENSPLSVTRMDVLMRHCGKMMPENAFEELRAIMDNQDGEMEMGKTVLLYYLAYKSGRVAVPYLIQWVEREDRDKEKFLMPAIRGWLDRDPAATVKFMQENKMEFPQLLKVLLDKVNDECVVDPEGTRKWIFSLDEESRNAALVQWLNGVACFYPERFFVSVKELPEDCFKDFRICGLISCVGSQLDLADTEVWMQPLLRSQKTYAREVSLMRLAEMSPGRAKEKFEQWSKEERQLRVGSMLMALAKHSLRDTLDWSEANFQKSPYFRSAVPEILRREKLSDKPEITHNIQKRKNSEVKDCIISRMVEENLLWLKKSDEDARRLVGLVMNIGEEYRKMKILDYVVALWATYSPSGAEKWIKETESLKPEKREYYLRMFENGTEPSDVGTNSRYSQGALYINTVKPFSW